MSFRFNHQMTQVTGFFFTHLNVPGVNQRIFINGPAGNHNFAMMFATNETISTIFFQVSGRQLGKPVVWLNTRRIVRSFKRGSSGPWGSGKYSVSGVSRSRMPDSHNFSAAQAKIGSLNDAASKTVSSVTNSCEMLLCTPKA